MTSVWCSHGNGKRQFVVVLDSECLRAGVGDSQVGRRPATGAPLLSATGSVQSQSLDRSIYIVIHLLTFYTLGSCSLHTVVHS